MFNFQLPQEPAGGVNGQVTYAVTVVDGRLHIRFECNGRWFICVLEAGGAAGLGRAILDAAGEIEPAIDWPEDLGDLHG